MPAGMSEDPDEQHQQPDTCATSLEIPLCSVDLGLKHGPQIRIQDPRLRPYAGFEPASIIAA
jgi:hypothetical protein